MKISRQKIYRDDLQPLNRAEHQKLAQDVVNQVQSVRNRMPRIGTRKLYHILQDEMREQKIGRDKLFKILRMNNLLVQKKKKYHKTTNSYHRFKKHKNLVENLEINRPEQVFVSDITYIDNSLIDCYLALITDAYSKKIMGFDVSESLATAGSLRALKMAFRNRQYRSEPLIHHSDRGVLYCSDLYQKTLQKPNVTVSMTESYSPYANAIAERINGILKQEFLLEEMNTDLKTMQRIVAQSVAIYNAERPHLSCGMHTPDFMHQQREIKIKTYKNKNFSVISERTLADNRKITNFANNNLIKNL